MDSAPSSGIEYNMRVLEVQCAGSMPLDEWYAIPEWERTMKVAAMIMPRMLEQGSRTLPSAMALE